jgi:hypothetical protein
MNCFGRKPLVAALLSTLVVALWVTSAAAQTGTLARRTLTFSNSGTATVRFTVPSLLVGDPSNPPSTTLVLEFGKDGSASVVDPALGNAVNFCLANAANCAGAAQKLSFAINSLPSGSTTFTGKQVSMSQPDAVNTPGLFVLSIVHTQSTQAPETWELALTGLPTNVTPAVRGMASLFGSQSGFTLLQPTGACGTGGTCPAGQSCQGPCPLCPACPPIRAIPCDRWIVIDFCPKCPLPCRSCPPDWERPIGEDFERVMVAFTPFDKEQKPLGPGKADQIRVNITGGEAVGGVLESGDGQYLQLIQFRKGQPARVSVNAAGVTSPEVLAVPRAAGVSPIYRLLTYVFGVLLLVALMGIGMMARRGGVARG